MSRGGMDFYAFKAGFEGPGGGSAGQPGTEGPHAILFERDEEGIYGRYKGLRVFEDRDHVGIVRPGQVWICTLELNPRTGRNYFATPARLVDASLILEAAGDEIAALAERIWASDPEFIEKALEGRIGSLAEERARTEIDARQRGFDARIAELEDRRAELESSVEAGDERIAELERAVAELEAANSAKDSEIEGLRPTAAEPPEEYVIVNEPSDETEQRIDGVLRWDPTTIRSNRLVHDRYAIRVDADWTVMILRPDPQGTVECLDNAVVIGPLAWRVPYESMSIIAAEFGDDGEITMHLA